GGRCVFARSHAEIGMAAVRVARCGSKSYFIRSCVGVRLVYFRAMILRWFLLLLISTAATAQTTVDIAAAFSDLTATEPGCAALVVNKGKTVFEQGYGLADLERRTPITPTTNFRLAS